jgi:hypothetical protein
VPVVAKSASSAYRVLGVIFAVLGAIAARGHLALPRLPRAKPTEPRQRGSDRRHWTDHLVARTRLGDRDCFGWLKEPRPSRPIPPAVDGGSCAPIRAWRFSALCGDSKSP